jgi:hypothetical protein
MSILLTSPNTSVSELLEIDGCMYFRCGAFYQEPSIDELKRVLSLIQSSIDNYNTTSYNTKKWNEELYSKYFPEFSKLSNKEEKNKSKEKRLAIKGTIYILKCNRTSLYKIGLTSRSVFDRLKVLKTANPDIVMYNYYENIEDIYLEEKLMHKKINKKRIDGEWFNLNNKDLKYLDTYLKRSTIFDSDVIPF